MCHIQKAGWTEATKAEKATAQRAMTDLLRSGAEDAKKDSPGRPRTKAPGLGVYTRLPKASAPPDTNGHEMPPTPKRTPPFQEYAAARLTYRA